ncbi:hypothetical protein K443DRAFT_2750 [Laccaria amethystina LaAM-08-1]|uniref:Uncharacterized protein n=1 Tax=Laccaria amethystina LaAM-08-1 TaxID=1095629 RepID=A0A0C9XPB0_9AGAR|nr:hypothetical protein K443DRAFT_2750 [Laccaria amethystina LaAM-08-1]
MKTPSAVSTAFSGTLHAPLPMQTSGSKSVMFTNNTKTTSARPYLDSSDAQSWDLLGRAYMAGQKYNKAYEAYQQPVYRDGRNPTFWFQ